MYIKFILYTKEKQTTRSYMSRWNKITTRKYHFAIVYPANGVFFCSHIHQCFKNSIDKMQQNFFFGWKFNYFSINSPWKYNIENILKIKFNPNTKFNFSYINWYIAPSKFVINTQLYLGVYLTNFLFDIIFEWWKNHFLYTIYTSQLLFIFL